MLPGENFPMMGCAKRNLYLILIVSLSAVSTVMPWRCGDNYDIRDEWLCDDSVDCLDGSDEAPANCQHKVCEEGMFRCNNTKCIDQNFLCDGEADCMGGDSSDEDPQLCMQTHGVEEVGKGTCKQKFVCEIDGTCFWHFWVCDGEVDCSDGSDEHNCPCEGDTLRCHIDGRPWCLGDLWRCDGVQHCDKGEDESSCKKISGFNATCDDGLYQCRSTNKCVPWDRVCDKHIDCRDGSDEGGLCHVNRCNKKQGQLHCQHECHKSPSGSVCNCFRGYRLANDDISCVDVDECAEMESTALHNDKKLARLYYSGIKRICSHYCHNIEGSFHCTCADGYSLGLDNYTCKANSASVPELFVVVGAGIRVASIRDPGKRGSFYDTIYEYDEPNETILDIALYDRIGAVFWTDSSGKLKMTNGTGVITINTELRPRAICVDWLSRNLVVSGKRSRGAAVHLMKLGEEWDQVELVAVQALKGVTDPVSLAVHPQKGLLFVADVRSPHKSSRILIAKSDGSEIKSLVDVGSFVPTDVVVDGVQEAVIWSSYDDDDAKVESIKFDGSQRGVIMSRKTGRFPLHPLSVTVFESHIYVADQTSREVRSWYMHDIELYGRQNTLYDSKEVVKLREMSVGVARMSHPALQRPMKGVNPCDSAACDGICVVVSRLSLYNTVRSKSVKLEARCLCPSGQLANKHARRCEAVSRTSSVAPVVTSPGSAETPISVSVSGKAGNQGQKKSRGYCRKPAPVRNSMTNLGGSTDTMYPIGHHITYFCDRGHSMQYTGSALQLKTLKITCLSNGTWDRQPTHCAPSMFWRAYGGADDKRLPVSDTTSSPSKKRAPTGISQDNSCGGMVCSESEVCVFAARKKKCVCRDNEGTGDCRTDLSESTVVVDAPSYSSSVNIVSYTTPSKSAPSGRHALSASEAVLTVLAVIAFFACILVCLKCVRKKRYSVDLRFSRVVGKTDTLDKAKDDASTDKSESKSGAASFTNPNYHAAGQRRRVLKPTFDDNDSGVPASLSSRSSSSTLSDAYGGEAGPRVSATDDPAAKERSLLPKDPGYDNDFVVEELTLEGLPTRAGRMRGRVERMFKIRRTESRECMLPQSDRP